MPCDAFYTVPIHNLWYHNSANLLKIQTKTIFLNQYNLQIHLDFIIKKHYHEYE